jgi:hypothetical protein
MGVGAAIQRQYRAGQWTGNVLVTTMDRKLLYALPKLQITRKVA